MVTLSATTYMKYKINQSAQTILMATTNVTTKYEIQDKSVCTNDICITQLYYFSRLPFYGSS